MLKNDQLQKLKTLENQGCNVKSKKESKVSTDIKENQKRIYKVLRELKENRALFKKTRDTKNLDQIMY